MSLISTVEEMEMTQGMAHQTVHQAGNSYLTQGMVPQMVHSGMSNVFQILGDIWKRQNQYNSCTIATDPEMATPFRTTTPSTPAWTMQQANPVHVHTLPVQNTSWNGPPAPCAHVHKAPKQVLKSGELTALQKVKTPYNGRTSVTRLPLLKQDILSHYSSCFEGIGHFPGELYKFYLKPEHKPARHAPRKISIHLEDAFKEEIKSFMKLSILEEVKDTLTGSTHMLKWKRTQETTTSQITLSRGN